MSNWLLRSSVIGALVVFFFSLGWLLFGPMSLWMPTGPFGEMFFSPGVFVGVLFNRFTSAPAWMCQAVGVLTMARIGGVLGLLIGLVLSHFRPRSVPP